MKFVPITKARMHFTELVPQVAAGEEIIVTQRGKPVMKLVRVDVSGRRPLGVDVGEMRIVSADPSLGDYDIDVIDATS